MRKISIRLMRNCKSGKYISINFSKKQIAKQHSLENFLAIKQVFLTQIIVH